MSIARRKKDQLVEEFNVQVYSSGRIHWDRLDHFIPFKSIAQETLLSRLKSRITGKPPQPLLV